ncbi:MAG: alpha/beta fold hydrolase [bacterium]
MPSFDMIEIEPGRRLHYIMEGPKEAPFVLFDAGAFGIYADGWHLKEALKRDFRICLYDRASMGQSDAVPPDVTPTPDFHVEDMRRLMAALGVKEKFTLIGHSMAGLRLHSFANLYKEELRGLVLLDALAPRQLTEPTGKPFGKMFELLLASGVMAAKAGITKAADKVAPNNFKLEGHPRADKIKAFTDLRHYTAAHREVEVVDYHAAYMHGENAFTLPMCVLSSTPINALTAEDVARSREATGYGYHEIFPFDGHVSLLTGKVPQKIAREVRAIHALGQ